MARFIHLTQIRGDSRFDSDTGLYVDQVFPTTVNVDTIRCFYPRHDGKVGTRITFADGGGFPVQETFDKVLVAVGAPDLSEAAQTQLAALAAPPQQRLAEDSDGFNDDELEQDEATED